MVKVWLFILMAHLLLEYINNHCTLKTSYMFMKLKITSYVVKYLLEITFFLISSLFIYFCEGKGNM